MVLRSSRFGQFYGCSEYPKCDGTHGARPDGTPLGKPADKETRAMRVQAHASFDRLWKGKPALMDRTQAYEWLDDVMGLSKEEGHISRMDKDQCQRLILLVDRYLSRAEGEGD